MEEKQKHFRVQFQGPLTIQFEQIVYKKQTLGGGGYLCASNQLPGLFRP